MISLYRSTYIGLVFLLVVSHLIFTCGCKPSGPAPEAGSGDFAGFEVTDIPGTSVKRALRKDAAGQPVLEGFIQDGKKTGTWMEYNNEGYIISVENYINGLLEGTVLKMSFRGQVDQKASYYAGQLNGPWIQYKFGKIIEERNYVNGKLDGVIKSYDDKTWKLRQEAQYKNGVQDGFFRYYDDNGNMTLEYQYKDGNKVSGGMVNKG